jgi:hypothetical protein
MNFPILRAASAAKKAGSLALIGLETLPCGCVSAIYRARPTVVELELVEAKGPHCVFVGHQMGHVVRLGLPESIDDLGDEALV